MLALHACDTATDDALASAVGWRSRYVLAAPCCQHDLQAQIDNAAAPPDYAPLLRHGIVRERLGDLLTDSLRAELLRAHGYRTDVIEFVSTEHTAKNLMIRAVRTDRPDPEASTAASVSPRRGASHRRWPPGSAIDPERSATSRGEGGVELGDEVVGLGLARPPPEHGAVSADDGDEREAVHAERLGADEESGS